MKSLDDLLQRSSWFHSLDATQQARVRQCVTVRDVPADGVVLRKGEPVEHWIGVVDGLVKISSVSFEGRAVSLAGIPPGGWFGEGSMLKDEPRRYDVIAVRDSRVAMMPGSTFEWLLDSSIPFNRFLLQQLNERLGQFIATVEFERMLGPEGRVARCLAQMFNPQLYPGSDLRLDISQSELGFLTGLSRQRVNQALRRLEERGLLRVDYGSVTVLDLQALREFEA